MLAEKLKQVLLSCYPALHCEDGSERQVGWFKSPVLDVAADWIEEHFPEALQVFSHPELLDSPRQFPQHKVAFILFFEVRGYGPSDSKEYSREEGWRVQIASEESDRMLWGGAINVAYGPLAERFRRK